MKAIPQPKTEQIVERINALQTASPYYIDPSTVTPLVREWRAIKREIDALMTVDACSAWELTGAWKGMTGDFDDTEEAFRNSARWGTPARMK